MINGAIHADLGEVKAQLTALSDCLAGLDPPGRQTGRGLSIIICHIIKDVDNILREIENDG
ncbi:hypothetical protein [Leadbettera azotonutricia]|uniref:Uncharacterized protein n=1 Tax=Leadbettera azotonutricia (strain ATCC BAA-888 / DSM 13862 / ZAS-9) TaxID=545695 RepID=F5YF72_LEAAZ|nr:hypothetical protein [Leadbettera azotonutricia]AEF82596.1 hypothetical protein TREAZ_2491 [Leadbettera azotonutricia ZAS-9]